MLILLEGFDHYKIASTDATRLELKGWVGQGNGGLPGRILYGPQSQCVAVILFNSITKVLPAITSDLVAGFAFQVPQLANTAIFQLKDQTFASNAIVGITEDGFLSVTDGTTVTVGTHPIVPGTWYYVEVKLSSGNAEVHLNGVADIGPVAGDFSNGWYLIEFGWDVLGGGHVLIDDVYVCDLTGDTNNDFLGDLIVETLYPINDGTYTDWTPDSGTAHYPRVNEFQIDEDASYVETAGAGNKDTYGMGNPSIPAGTEIFGVQLNLGLTKLDAGVRTLNPLIRQAGTDYEGPTTYATTDWGFVSWLLDQDPSGSDWTAENVMGDEYGIELTT